MSTHPGEAAKELAQSLAQEGAEVEVLVADFTAKQAIARFCDDLAGRFGAPDVIVNNASVFQHDFPGRADAENLAASLAVHVMAPFMIVEAAAEAKKTGPAV